MKSPNPIVKPPFKVVAPVTVNFPEANMEFALIAAAVVVPVIVGDVKVLFVNVCIASNCTISSFAILAIFVAVPAFPVTSPVTFPVTSDKIAELKVFTPAIV